MTFENEIGNSPKRNFESLGQESYVCEFTIK